MSTEEIKALLEERALGQKGQIHFSMADCSTVVKDVSVVGNVIQDWLGEFFTQNGIS